MRGNGNRIHRVIRKSNNSVPYAAPAQQTDAKVPALPSDGAKRPCYHRRRFFNRSTPPSPTRLMADASDSHAPPLAYRILAAVRSCVAIHRKAAFALVLASMMAAIPAAGAQETDTVTLNFVNADIDAVVKAVAEITGRNFVLDPRVKGTINIVSARPVPKSLVYPTLLSALRLQGFAAVEGDGIVKIVPETDAKQQGGPVGGAGTTG